MRYHVFSIIELRTTSTFFTASAVSLLTELYLKAWPYFTIMWTTIFFYHDATAPCGPRPPHYGGFMIILSYTHHTRWNSSGRVINPTQRPLPDTQHSQEAVIHAPGGIRTHSPSKRAAAHPRLRPRGHWDRRTPSLLIQNCGWMVLTPIWNSGSPNFASVSEDCLPWEPSWFSVMLILCFLRFRILK